MSKNLPIVAIVGRTNAGKSSLMNAMINKPVAITAREEGTTRDRVWEKAENDGKSFWLVDTAGLKTADDEFEATINQQIDESIDTADLILFVIDSSSPMDALDQRMLKKLIKIRSKVITVLNKSDRKNAINRDDIAYAFEHIVYSSASQRIGMVDILNTISSLLPERSSMAAGSDEATTVSFIGRPNTGKSSLFNALGQKQQAIVSSSSGTTRDLNRLRVNYKSDGYEFIDTAGIKRPSRTMAGVEKFSYLRSLWAIENSDICILTIDSQEIAVGLEQKMASMISDAGKGLIIAITKWDLLESDPDNGARILSRIRQQFRFVPWASVIFTSSMENKNITQILEIVRHIEQVRSKTITTPEANQLLSSLVVKHPPAGLKSVKPRMRYMTQTGTNPASFKIFGQNASKVHPSYERYLLRGIHEALEIDGSPVMLSFEDS